MSYIKVYEYESSVNPSMPEILIMNKSIDEIDYGFNPVDISKVYNMDFPCTSPNLLASFIKIKSKNDLTIEEKIGNFTEIFNASSHFFYVISGKSCIRVDEENFNVSDDEIIVIPCSQSINIKNISEDDLIIYYINDSPIVNYLGCKSTKPIFKVAHYSHEFIQNNLKNLSNPKNNRKGILLGNADTERIGNKTITPTLWSLYNELPPRTNQTIHRHNSVALDLCISCEDSENIFTLMGSDLDENGQILNPIKMNWKKGMMFITPPGLWHSHHNLGDTYAYILPVQDAGLLLYQRILGIDLHK